MSRSVTVTVVEHPVVADALARIRDVSTPNALFRQNLERIGSLLLVRATEDLPTVDTTVTTPLTEAPARRLAVQPVVVPILRAGLGFVHAAQELLPDADVGFVGISRDEETFAPKPYVNKLPESLAGRPVIVIDPMLATGGSLVHTIELLLAARRPAADHRGVRAVRAGGHRPPPPGGAVRPRRHRRDRRPPQRPRLHRPRPRRRRRPPVRPPRLTHPFWAASGSLVDFRTPTSSQRPNNGQRSRRAEPTTAFVIDRRDLGADRCQVRRRRFVVALDLPTDRGALTPPLLVGALAEIPAVPPRVAGFERRA